MANEGKPLVSVALITYNHARYIEQAVQGILSQQGVGEIEVILGDDLSGDGTAEMAERLLNGGVRLNRLKFSEKMGMNRNWLATINACSGQYVALLEGDDFWSDPQKLAKQVALMQAEPSVNVCFTDASVINENPDGRTFGTYCQELEVDLTHTRYGFEDLVRLNFMATATVLYRNLGPLNMPPAYFNSPYVDWIFHLNAAQNGHVALIPTVTSAYRLHGSGAFGGITGLKRKQNTVLSLAAAHDAMSMGRNRQLLLQRYLRAIDDYAYALETIGSNKKDLIKTQWVSRISRFTKSTLWSKWL